VSRMSRRVIDLAGRKFGHLTVLSFVGVDKFYQAVWKVRCACGKKRDAVSRRVRNGDLRSCGHCTLMGFHGAATGEQTKEYKTWAAMNARCRRNPRYVRRRIRVCKRWRLFINFLADMGPAPRGARWVVSIERKDNAKGYTPKNCVWVANRKVQMRNKTNSRRLRFDGRVQVLAAWAEELGLSYWVIHSRLRRRWTVRATFTTPVGGTR
jgi:hypothetical protein